MGGTADTQRWKVAKVVVGATKHRGSGSATLRRDGGALEIGGLFRGASNRKFYTLICKLLRARGQRNDVNGSKKGGGEGGFNLKKTRQHGNQAKG